MKIVIDLPVVFERRLKKLLRTLEIPASEIPKLLPDWCFSENLCTEENLWTEFYVYPDRETAARAALNIIENSHRRAKPVKVLSFRESGRESVGAFVNPRVVSLLRSTAAELTFESLATAFPCHELKNFPLDGEIIALGQVG